MEKKFSKGSEEWMMFQDYWKLCQEVWSPEESDEYWEDAIERAEEFYKKYQSPFSKELALALIHDLERRYRDGEGVKILS